MLLSLRHVVRYRGLVASLVARELRARYRGSVLGFCWSFVNPLLLLLVYTFVFTVVLPGARPAELEPFAVFMFCGILPWTWFSSSLLESSTVLITSGNLIRKTLFPAEILPIVTVLAGAVHFCLGLPILVGFLAYYRVPVVIADLLWFPVIVCVQLVLTLGLALLLSAATVHFRDVRDLLSNLLTLWFFGTPIIYAAAQVPPRVGWILALNPMTHLVVAYQETLFTSGRFERWPALLFVGAGSVLTFTLGFFVFDRLRETLAEEV